MDKSEAREIHSMIHTEGYRYLRQFIEDNLQSAETRLITGSFADLKDVVIIQSEIATYNKLLQYIDRADKKYKSDER